MIKKEVKDMKDNREAIIRHHSEMIQWVKSLNNLPAEEWFRPIDENKWSIAEIISHFGPWDDFVLNMRLPYLGNSDPLPKAPDPQNLNEQSSSRARSTEQSTVIQSFIDSRNRLLTSICEIPERSWGKTFKLGEKELTLSGYLEGLADHDLHHKTQIEQVMNRKNAQI
jgi:uncharacterized damage-inducible protein DinB